MTDIVRNIVAHVAFGAASQPRPGALLPQGISRAACAVEQTKPILSFFWTPFSACSTRNPHHIIYYRLWLIPPVFDLGVLTQDRTEVFRVWNAFRAQITIAGTSIVGDVGLSLPSTVTPFTVPSLGVLLQQLHVSVSGPPNLRAEVIYTPLDAEPARMTVKGLRAIALEARPNWKYPVIERHAFRTDVWESWSGREFRRAMREMPRASLQFKATQWDLVAQQTQWRLDQLTDAYVLTRRWGMFVRTSAAAAAGDAMIQVSRTPWWLRVGDTVSIREGNHTISAIDTANKIITVSPPLVEDIPEGTKVYGTLAGRLKETNTAEWLTDEVQEVTLEVETDSGTQKFPAPPDPAPVWQGYPLFEFAFNWKNKQRLTWRSKRLVVDYGVGPRHVTNPAGRTDILLRATYYDLRRQDVDQLLGFFHAMKGRAGEFWVPSEHMDIRLARDYSPSEGFLVVPGVLLGGAMSTSKIHGAVRIILPDGTPWLSLVSSFAVVGDESRVSLASAPAIELPQDTRVEFLYRARFASDILSVEWLSDEVARVSMTFQVLEVI